MGLKLSLLYNISVRFGEIIESGIRTNYCKVVPMEVKRIGQDRKTVIAVEVEEETENIPANIYLD